MPLIYRKHRIIHPLRRSARTHGFGRAAASTADPYLGVGSFWPGGLVSPNNWDSWDFYTTMDLSQIPDSTVAVQNAINAAQISGQGGGVNLPPGVIRINGAVISGGGVTIRGAGWEEYTPGSSPAQRGKRGTYVLSDTGTAFTIAQNAAGASIQDMAFIQPYDPDRIGWSAPGLAAPIVMTGPNAGSALIQRCLFWATSSGITIGSNNVSPQGLIVIRDCEFAVFSRGVNILGAAQVVIDAPKMTTVPYATGNSHIANSAFVTAIGVYMQSVLQATITAGYFNGFGTPMLTASGASAPAQAKASDCTIVNCGGGIADQGTTTYWKVQGFNHAGLGSLGPSYGIALNGIGCSMDITDCQLRNYASAAIAAQSGGIGQIRLGPNLSIDNWNLNPTSDVGLPNPSPAIYCPATSGTSGVWYSLNGSRFTNSNGGANTGGGGTFTTY